MAIHIEGGNFIFEQNYVRIVDGTMRVVCNDERRQSQSGRLNVENWTR